jgi:predicted ester cyclase
METENIEIIRLIHEKINNRDFAAALELIAPDASNHGMKVGREGYEMVWRDILATFPDFTLKIEEIIAAGDNVVVRAIFGGTHLGIGELPVNGGMLIGIEPTRQSFGVQHIHWYKLRDGKISEHYACREDLEMMQQLGLLPQQFNENKENFKKINA